jgi:lysozyme family protein
MAKFELSIPVVLANEGGYVNDPNDAGGETKYGISKRSYPQVDIANLTVGQATAIYLRDFWKYDDVHDQALATKIFDMSVNMGRTAIRILQKLLNLPVDGIWGPTTCGHLNAAEPVSLLARYKEELSPYYLLLVHTNPNEEKFLKGWLERANA